MLQPLRGCTDLVRDHTGAQPSSPKQTNKPKNPESQNLFRDKGDYQVMTPLSSRPTDFCSALQRRNKGLELLSRQNWERGQHGKRPKSL